MAWAAWTQAKKGSQAVARVQSLRAELQSSAQGGRLPAHAPQDATGCRNLRYAPLVRSDKRAAFLRWFADESAAAEPPPPPRPIAERSETDGVREAAAEVAATVDAVALVIAALAEVPLPGHGGKKSRSKKGASRQLHGQLWA